jgi:Fe-Mn family superoxide dismutase
MIRINTAAKHILHGRMISTAKVPFSLPPLPYEMNALEPHISRETLEFHYGKHHKTYVDNLNKFAEQEKSLASKSLEDIIRISPAGPIFNNAAQVWNHTFYWNSMSPNGGGSPKGSISDAINRDFGSFENFKSQFSAKALSAFGSGWAFLVKDSNGKLKIVECHDAMTPLRDGSGKPIITCDVWEHAYYIDSRNARGKYIESWWNVVNWEFAEQNYSTK